MAQKLTIGKVAAAAAVNVETIRFYQRRGLLVEPRKSQGGFRYYDEATIVSTSAASDGGTGYAADLTGFGDGVLVSAQGLYTPGGVAFEW